MNGRRAMLGAGALAVPLLAAFGGAGTSAAEYATAAEALDALDRLETDVASRLRAIEEAFPGARRLAASMLADQRARFVERADVRRRLGLAASRAPAASPSGDRDLAALRSAQEALVYAHAEGLPALGDPLSVRVLARHLVATAGQLAVLDLWIESEERGGR